MSTWIALMRGIGGGIRPLPMKDLRDALDKIGLTNIRTYIQSGNVVFDASRTNEAKLAKRIDAQVTEVFGFNSKTIVLTPEKLAEAVRKNPFPAANDNPKSLHLYFLWQAARSADLKKLDQLKTGREAFVLTDDVFYLYTPDGFGTSKLAEKAGGLLKVEATARNWRTVNNVLQLATAE